MKSQRKGRIATITIAGAVALALISTSCSRKEESKSGTSSSLSAAKAPAVNFAGGLVALLPAETVAFFLFEGKHPAYQKYVSSPWGQGKTDFSTVLDSADARTKEIVDILKRVGLDPKDTKTWKGLFAEAAFFASAGKGADAPAFGAVVRSDASVELPKILEGIKGTIPATEASVEEVKFAKGTGVKIVSKGNNPPFFVGWNGNLGVFGSAEWLVNSVLTSSGSEVPAIASGSVFERSMKGLPENDLRLGTGFVDVQKLTEVSKKLDNNSSAAATAELPVTAFSFAMGMDETPRTHARLVYDEAKGSQNEWLKTISTSDSGSVAGAVSAKPLLFLSLDGQTLRKIRDTAIAKQAGNPAAQMASAQLAFLDDIKRIGLAIRTAPMGQALLPVPDLLILLESNQAARTAEQVQSIVSQAAAGSGMAGMPWTDSKVNDVAVKSMVSPLGVGLYLASTKNLVIAASTEGQMKAALAGAGGFTGGLTPKASAVFGSEASLGNLYLNFEEVAGMLESMGGMMAMYAPQNKDAAKLLEPESLESIRKMGTVIGSVKVESGIIGIDSYYQAQPPA